MINAFVYFPFMKSFAALNKHGFCNFFCMLQLICYILLITLLSQLKGHILFFLLDDRATTNRRRNSSRISCWRKRKKQTISGKYVFTFLLFDRFSGVFCPTAFIINIYFSFGTFCHVSFKRFY